MYKYYNAKIDEYKEKFNMKDGLIVEGFEKKKEETLREFVDEKTRESYALSKMRLAVGNVNYKGKTSNLWFDISKN